MGSCMSSSNDGSRQDNFRDLIESISNNRIDRVTGQGTLPSGGSCRGPNIGTGPIQMATGRVSAAEGIITSPVSNSPCVAYHLEIAQLCFTGDNISNYGKGYKCVYSEKRSVSFHLVDSRFPKQYVRVGEYGDIFDLRAGNSERVRTSLKAANQQPALDILTDVVVAHIHPSDMVYAVPYVQGGEIQATESIIRGYPMRFGMLDGEGDGARVELPENIEALFEKHNITRRTLKSSASMLDPLGCPCGGTDGVVESATSQGLVGKVADSGSPSAVADVDENVGEAPAETAALGAGAGAGAGAGRGGSRVGVGSAKEKGAEGEEKGEYEYEETTFVVLEMTIRVNDQVSVIGCFQDDPSKPEIKHAVPISGDYSQYLDVLKAKGIRALKGISRNRPAILVSKFPKVSHIPPLAQKDIFDQEEGALEQFKLAGAARQQRENRDLAAASAANLAKLKEEGGEVDVGSHSGSRPGTSAGIVSTSSYLFSAAGKERLAAKGVVFETKPGAPSKSNHIGSVSHEGEEDPHKFDFDKDAGDSLLP